MIDLSTQNGKREAKKIMERLLKESYEAQDIKFSGSDYKEEIDHERLESSLVSILRLMGGGEWKTVQEVANGLNLPNVEAVGAQIRNIRKIMKDGRHVYQVERRNRDGIRGYSEYRVQRFEQATPIPKFQYYKNQGYLGI